jgi:hypothetical protein
LVGLLMEWLTPQKAGAVLDLLSPVRTQKLLPPSWVLPRFSCHC